MDENSRDLENKRRTIRGLLTFSNVSSVTGAVLASILLILLFVHSPYAVWVLLVLVVLIVISAVPCTYTEISIRKRLREFEAELREKIVSPYMYDRYGSWLYIGQGKFSKEEIDNFRVIPNSDLLRTQIKQRSYYNSEDYIRGTYNGVHYEQSSVQMQLYPPVYRRYAYRNGWLRRLKPKYPFNGRVVLFSNPRFQGVNSVRIITKSFRQSRWIGFHENVVRTNEQFDRDFYVTATNPQEAYNLLTPQLMAEIANIKNQFSDFTIFINQGMVFIAVAKLESPFDRVYNAPIDRNQVYQMADEYMNVTSRLLNTFLAVFL